MLLAIFGLVSSGAANLLWLPGDSVQADFPGWSSLDKGAGGRIGFRTSGMAPRFNDRKYSDLLLVGLIGRLPLEIERALI